MGGLDEFRESLGDILDKSLDKFRGEIKDMFNDMIVKGECRCNEATEDKTEEEYIETWNLYLENNGVNDLDFEGNFPDLYWHGFLRYVSDDLNGDGDKVRYFNYEEGEGITTGYCKVSNFGGSINFTEMAIQKASDILSEETIKRCLGV